MAKKSAVNRNEMVKALVKQYASKRDALKAIANDESLPLEEYKKLSPVFDEDVYKAIDLAACVAARKVPGGPAKESVEAQIRYLKDFLSARNA